MPEPSQIIGLRAVGIEPVEILVDVECTQTRAFENDRFEHDVERVGIDPAVVLIYVTPQP